MWNNRSMTVHRSCVALRYIASWQCSGMRRSWQFMVGCSFSITTITCEKCQASLMLNFKLWKSFEIVVTICWWQILFWDVFKLYVQRICQELFSSMHIGLLSFFHVKMQQSVNDVSFVLSLSVGSDLLCGAMCLFICSCWDGTTTTPTRTSSERTNL